MVDRVLSKYVQRIGGRYCVGVCLTWCRKFTSWACWASGWASSVFRYLQGQLILFSCLRRSEFWALQANLDSKTTYELIQSHGRTDVYLHYAMVINDLERVIEHWVMEEEWVKALDVLVRQVCAWVYIRLPILITCIQPNLELYYRFGPVLVRQAPKETVDAWLKRDALDPLRLVPALLRLQDLPRDPLSPNHAIRYLNYVVFEQQNVSPTIHNLLATFHISNSSPEDDGPILRFLNAAPSDPFSGKPYYDLDYVLRLCIQAGRTQPCVHIYSKMGLYENSVDLALEKGDVELAKINANMPDDDWNDLDTLARSNVRLNLVKSIYFIVANEKTT